MRAYLYIAVTSLCMSQAMAIESRQGFLRVSAGEVEAVQTRSYGYVSSAEITSGAMRVDGVTHNDTTITVDAKNPSSEVTSVVYTNGTQVGITDGRVLGGDMGGGGSRRGNTTDVRQATSVSIGISIR